MIAWVRTRLRGEAGYSLIEMLTVMVIMSIVFAGITQIFVAGSKAQTDQENRFQAQLAGRLALDKIRRDIHCAKDVTPYTASSVTLVMPACGGDVSWCTVAVSGYTNRYRLYRQSGGSCGSSGLLVADYLTNASAFPTFTNTSGCNCLASLKVDFVISTNKRNTTLQSYELTDTIYLRNWKRA